MKSICTHPMALSYIRVNKGWIVPKVRHATASSDHSSHTRCSTGPGAETWRAADKREKWEHRQYVIIAFSSLKLTIVTMYYIYSSYSSCLNVFGSKSGVWEEVLDVVLLIALAQWLACPRPLLVAGDGELVHDSDVKWWKQLGISTTLPGIKHWPQPGLLTPHVLTSHRPAERPRGDSGDQNNNKDFEGEMCTLFSHKMKIGWRHFLRWRTWSMTSR